MLIVVARKPTAGFDPDEMFYEHTNESRRSDDLSEDSEDATVLQRPVHYAYDAAAERMKERMREGGRAVPPSLVGEVH